MWGQKIAVGMTVWVPSASRRPCPGALGSIREAGGPLLSSVVLKLLEQELPWQPYACHRGLRQETDEGGASGSSNEDSAAICTRLLPPGVAGAGDLTLISWKC